MSVGTNATILPVTICDQVVIGAGAVVTKDITVPGIYAGNPARLLRPPLAVMTPGLSPRSCPLFSIMKIPIVDLHAQYLTIKQEIDGAIAEVIAESAYIGGRHVDAFEQAWASAVGVKRCVSCANGTDAIYIALRGLRCKARRRGHHLGTFLDLNIGNNHAGGRPGRIL